MSIIEYVRRQTKGERDTARDARRPLTLWRKGKTTVKLPDTKLSYRQILRGRSHSQKSFWNKKPPRQKSFKLAWRGTKATQNRRDDSFSLLHLQSWLHQGMIGTWQRRIHIRSKIDSTKEPRCNCFDIGHLQLCFIPVTRGNSIQNIS